MRLQDFHLELVERASTAQLATLRELRGEVSAKEIAPSDTCAPDDIDTAAWHVLARDPAGQALGCGSLAGARIECLVVRAAWRGQGIGSALLQELIARAGTLGQEEITLATPGNALAFFQRAGFTAGNAGSDHAGTPHRMLRLPIARKPVRASPMRDVGALAAGSRSEVSTARLQLLADTRHQLLIYLPALTHEVLGHAGELEQLRRIACSGRAASIRIVLHDPAAAVTQDHPLLPLAQRLPSAFQMRTPTDPADLAYASAYLVNDSDGYLFLPDANRPDGRAARKDGAAQASLRLHFNDAWERAERATILNVLDL